MSSKRLASFLEETIHLISSDSSISVGVNCVKDLDLLLPSIRIVWTAVSIGIGEHGNEAHLSTLLHHGTEFVQVKVTITVGVKHLLYISIGHIIWVSEHLSEFGERVPAISVRVLSVKIRDHVLPLDGIDSLALIALNQGGQSGLRGLVEV